MEIGKVYQGHEQIVVSAQSGNNQQVGDKPKVTDNILKDFQVTIQDGFKIKLAEFANILSNRTQLIQSLPEDIRKAVVELLGQMPADTELPQGLENLLKGQKNTSEQLKNMSNILYFSATLQSDEHSEVKGFLQKAFENFTKQTEKTPEQSAKELVQLAKQLPVSHAVTMENVSQALEHLLEQRVPEKLQQLNKNEQNENYTKQTEKTPEQLAKELVQLAKQLPVSHAVTQGKVIQTLEHLLEQRVPGKMEQLIKNQENVLAKSTNVLEQDMPAQLQQLKTLIQQLKNYMFVGDPKLLAKQQHVLDQVTKLFELNIPQVLQEGGVKHKLPELPKIWTLLKALDAEQWQGLESQNLHKSAGVVKELSQSIYKSTNLAGEKLAEHSTLSFSMPLHVAEGIYYPAHIHIYHEEKNNTSQLSQREFETWLRICVDTENIGMVDSVFRLYGDNKLDIRVNIPDISAANQFTQDLPDVRKSLDGTILSLTDIMINKA